MCLMLGKIWLGFDVYYGFMTGVYGSVMAVNRALPLHIYLEYCE